MNTMLCQQRFLVQMLILCATLLLCLLPLHSAQAAPVTCHARYEAVVTYVDGKLINKVIRFGGFQTQGRGRMPARAAAHAKQNAEQCMQSHWQARASSMVPYQCQNQMRIIGYQVQNLEQTLQQNICQRLSPLSCLQGNVQVSYSLFATVDGEPGCGIGRNVVSRTLLGSGLTTLCQCQGNMPGRDQGRDRDRWPDHTSRRQLPAPQQVSPAQGTTFYHIPRTILVSWQPVERAASYLVEVKYHGRVWTSLTTHGNATFATFDFPGAGQGDWRVTAQSRRGRQGMPSPWYSFSYQR